MFFFSGRKRHTIYIGDWSSDGALPISAGAEVVELRVMPDRRPHLDGTVAVAAGRAAPERLARSEERRVGKEGRSWGAVHAEETGRPDTPSHDDAQAGESHVTTHSKRLN